jgi:hypothetical protein
MLVYSMRYDEPNHVWRLIQNKDNYDDIIDEFDTYGECIAEANIMCKLNNGTFDRYGSDLLQKV